MTACSGSPPSLRELRQAWLDTGGIDALEAFLGALDAVTSGPDLDSLDPPPGSGLERASSAVAAVFAAVAFMVMAAGIAWLAAHNALTATP